MQKVEGSSPFIRLIREPRRCGVLCVRDGTDCRLRASRRAYDEELARRIRELLADEPDVVEKRMFGGLAFLAEGHMAVAAGGHGGLMVRCDPDDTDELVAEPHARPMKMRGKAMRGWLQIDAEGTATDEQLESWVRPAIAYTRSLR